MQYIIVHQNNTTGQLPSHCFNLTDFDSNTHSALYSQNTVRLPIGQFQIRKYQNQCSRNRDIVYSTHSSSLSNPGAYITHNTTPRRGVGYRGLVKLRLSNLQIFFSFSNFKSQTLRSPLWSHKRLYTACMCSCKQTLMWKIGSPLKV